MKEILESMESLTAQLKELEGRMAKGSYKGKNVTEMLGANPQLGFSKLVEFKAAVDRMRGLAWVYMEAAASTGRFPAQRIPQALKEFLQQQAPKPHSSSASADKKTG
jgi:hypothetical protein